ncbi:hypothetical protein HanXRQr2_Chr04g0153721 [Helianthus annuus]|uniref:Uncharacterized protein n=1 Tax=Helianthus annuus TaxID=4232 RepID=A0A9K3J5J6_HELAN|nr:hypothetical protein HanXRQr2_Chr04g0153721 [Helianthus annuus]KAJ0930329.1 hypothetical protein HanPSC8_Chr04g0148021 [Helianthus annuus]
MVLRTVLRKEPKTLLLYLTWRAPFHLFLFLDVTDTPDSMLAKDEVKRNLVQVYDVEEDSHTSATKVHKSGEVKDANSAEKRNLIIPKIEK